MVKDIVNLCVSIFSIRLFLSLTTMSVLLRCLFRQVNCHNTSGSYISHKWWSACTTGSCNCTNINNSNFDLNSLEWKIESITSDCLIFVCKSTYFSFKYFCYLFCACKI